MPRNNIIINLCIVFVFCVFAEGTLLNSEPRSICMTKVLDNVARINDNDMQPVRSHTTI